MDHEIADIVSIILSITAKRLQISQRDLAKKLGTNQSKISKLMGGRSGLLIDDADKIARVLGLNLWEVIKRADELTPDRSIKFTSIAEKLHEGF